MPQTRRPSFLRSFLATEAAGGIILMAVAALALIVANSPLGEAYFHTRASVSASSPNAALMRPTIT